MNDALVVAIPTWFAVLMAICASGVVTVMLLNNASLRSFLELYFERDYNELDARRWRHLIQQGMFIGTDEDGRVILIVPYDEQDEYRDDPYVGDIMARLDKSVVGDVESVTLFVDEMRNPSPFDEIVEDEDEVEEAVGDLLPDRAPTEKQP